MNRQSRKTVIAILVCFLINAWVSTALADQWSAYKGIAPDVLLGKSLLTPSNIEKTTILSYLARYHSKTAAGMCANAWITDFEMGFSRRVEQQVASLYLKCHKKFPEHKLTLAFTLFSFSEKNRGVDKRVVVDIAKKAESAIKGSDDELDESILLNLAHVYKKELRNNTAYDSLLKQRDLEFPENGTTDYIRHFYTRDKQAKLKYLESAVAKGTKKFDCYEALALFRWRNSNVGKMSANGKFALIESIVNYFKIHKGSSPMKAVIALNYIAEFADAGMGDKHNAFSLYKDSFNLYPTAEAAIGVYNTMMLLEPEITRDFMLKAKTTLPGNYKINEILVYIFQILNEKKRIQQYLDNAIAYAPTNTTRRKIIDLFAYTYYQWVLLDFDKAEKLLLSNNDPSINRNDLLNNYLKLYKNRFFDKDFDAAEKYLETFKNYGGHSLLYNRLNKELQGFIQNRKKVETHKKNFPFMTHWEKEFGQGLKISINFSSKSAVIPKKELPKLARIVKFFKNYKGKDYILQIEGHADNTEAGKADVALSQKRAESVAAYIRKYCKIKNNRLSIEGIGSHYPLVPNVTNAGKTKNRRVEIVPVGNSKKPELSVTTSLVAAKTLALSPDGRLLVCGQKPTQVWDIRAGIKLLDLGRSDVSPVFSPNGRYLAALYNYTDPDNNTFSDLIVYDIKTGLPVVEQGLYNISYSLAWNPGGTKLALSVGNDLVVYDFTNNKFEGIVSIDNRGNPADVVWDKLNRYIFTGKQRGKLIHVWDPKTLDLVKVLEGVDWVHAMGQSFDGKYLLVADNVRQMSVWDINDWTRRQKKIPTIPKKIVPHPTRPIVALNDFASRGFPIVLFDYKAMKPVLEKMTTSELDNIAFSPDGKTLYSRS